MMIVMYRIFGDFNKALQSFLATPLVSLIERIRRHRHAAKGAVTEGKKILST